MNYQRGSCSIPQDLRPLPEPKVLGAGPMPMAMVPLVFILHIALLTGAAWGIVNYAIYKKSNESFQAELRNKTEADARSAQVRADIEANARARAFFSQHERLLAEATPTAPVLPKLLSALPPNQKVVRVSLRRADDARDSGEMLLRIEMANEGPLTNQILTSFQDELVRRGLPPSNLATRSDARMNYIEGRITTKVSK